jgi:site-specific recombinase XerD
VTTDDIIARFTSEYLEFHSITQDRVRRTDRLLREFQAHVGKPLTEVDSSDLTQFVAMLVKQKFHVNTVRRKLNEIRPFVRWMWQCRLIDAEAYMGLMDVKPPRGATAWTTPNPYKRTEIEAFWQQVDTILPLLPEKGKGSFALRRWLSGQSGWNPYLTRHALRLQLTAMTRLALDLGLRRAEIYGLSLADLHYDNAYLVVTGKADPNTGHPKVRSVPFTTTARQAVFEWVEFRALMRPEHDRSWLALTQLGKRFGTDVDSPLSYRTMQTLLQEQIGPDWRWHRFRHTAATNWLRAGVQLETVSRLLGHATLQQTLRYAEILKSDVAREMGKAEEQFAALVGPAVAA